MRRWSEDIPGTPPPFERPFSDDLHGLRGIASLAVFADHFIDLLTRDDPVLGQFHRFGGGLSAVALFFVMSGVVLGISLRRFTPQPAVYAKYAVRRAFRLLPMIIVSCTIGFAFSRVALHSTADPRIFGDLFFRFYATPISVQSLVFTWTGLSAVADPPMWSIYVEIFGSALLPLFVLTSRSARGSIALCICLLALSLVASGADGHLLRNHWPVYMINFSVGLLLCHLGRRISSKINALSGRAVFILASALFVVLMVGRTALNLGEHGNAIGNLFDVTVASALVLLLMERKPQRGSIRHLTFLGDISYPLYLLHWPILCFLLAGSVQVLGAEFVLAHLGLWAGVMFVGSLALLLGLSIASYRFIERPAIALGKKLTDGGMVRRTPPVVAPT